MNDIATASTGAAAPEVPPLASGSAPSDTDRTPRVDASEYEMHDTWTGATMRKCKNGGWVDADFAREMELENARLRDAHVAITEIVKQILRAWDDGANYRHMAPEIAALRKHCKPNGPAQERRAGDTKQ